MIPDEAVEAAAKAFIEHGTLLPALEAAAPHMLAAVWDEGFAVGWDCEGDVSDNPYREATRGDD